MKKFKSFIYGSVIVSLFMSLTFAQTTKLLFKIERSKNANLVRYDAKIDNDGRIDKETPIDYYWLLYASDGSREEIAKIERRAYGFSIKYNEAGHFDMQMNAVKDRKLKILLINSEPKAEILINGRNAYLSKIYINSEDNFLSIPVVNYYTLTGNDIETGEEIEEKIAVKKSKTEETK